MTRLEQIEALNARLLAGNAGIPRLAARVPMETEHRRRLLRSLMNLRPPMSLDPEFLAAQDRLLSEEREERGVVDASGLPEVPGRPGMALWQGDITRLKCDAVVNAANSALLGVLLPLPRLY